MPAKNTLKRTVILFLGSIIAVLVAWKLLKELTIKSFIVDSLHSEINHYFEDSVQFQIEDISFQFVEKKIILEEVRLNLVAQNDTLASLDLSNISISWDDYWETFNDQLFKFKTVELKNAKLFLPLDFEKIKLKKASRPSFDGKLELDLEEFLVEEGEILFYDSRNEKSGRLTAEYDLLAKNLYFQKGKIPKSFQDIAEDIFLEFHDLSYFLKDDLHKVDIEKLAFDLFKQDIKLTSVHFRPLYNPKEFAKIKAEESNHIDILLDSIQLSRIRWQGDSMISINTIHTKGIELKVTKDKNYPLPNDRFIPILVEQLKKSSISIDVRKCIIENMNLSYNEIPKGSQDVGKMHITNIQAVVNNITNRKDSISEFGDYLGINATGDLYDKGKLTAEIKYKLDSKYGFFMVEGNLQPMPIEAINAYMTKSYPIEIISGQVDDLYFSYSGGTRAVSGEMEFKYSDFKIKFHKILNEEEKGDKTLTWLANVALSQQNPRKGGRFRIGKIEFTRDTRKSMFSYWASSLVSGFQSTVGVKQASRIEKIQKDRDGDENIWQKIGIGKNKNGE